MTDRAPEPLRNEYAMYTGKRGICNLCCVNLSLDKLRRLLPEEQSIMERYNHATNASHNLVSANVCIDVVECTRLINLRIGAPKT